MPRFESLSSPKLLFDTHTKKKKKKKKRKKKKRKNKKKKKITNIIKVYLKLTIIT